MADHSRVAIAKENHSMLRLRTTRPITTTETLTAEGNVTMRLSAQSRCSSCGSGYDVAQWSGLRLVKRLSAEEVAPYVICWPSHAVIEARECARCGRTISHITEDARGQRRPKDNVDLSRHGSFGMREA